MQRANVAISRQLIGAGHKKVDSLTASRGTGIQLTAMSEMSDALRTAVISKSHDALITRSRLGTCREVSKMFAAVNCRTVGLALIAFVFPGLASAYEGFGAVTRGADECSQPSVFHVTNLEDSGAGSLRDALSKECRRIVFDVSGTIYLKTRLNVPSFTTLDGGSAPATPGEYGITIRKFGGDKKITLMEVVQSNDVVINNIRFIGEGFDDGRDSLSLIGCDRIVIDHISSGYADDGALDISWGWGWGNNDTQWANRNITVSNSIIHNTAKAMLIKYGPHHNLSIHHNVFARNVERSPQIRHQVEVLDFVNNIVFDWGVPATWGYGLRIASHDPDTTLTATDPEMKFGGDGLIDMNIVGNMFVEGNSPTPEMGITYLTVSTGTGEMGELYYEDNILPTKNRALSSTTPGPLAIPPEARVTTHRSDELAGVLLPTVGPKYRTPEEQNLIDEIAASLGTRPKPPILD